MACRESVYGKEKEKGRRGTRKAKEFIVHMVGIRKEFRSKFKKILSINAMDTGVPGE
jgi:hypothetical protein